MLPFLLNSFWDPFFRQKRCPLKSLLSVIRSVGQSVIRSVGQLLATFSPKRLQIFMELHIKYGVLKVKNW